MSRADIPRILFMCYGNVARSQMAEAFYNRYTDSDKAISAAADIDAGKRYKRPVDEIVKVMREEGIDISSKSVKPVTESMMKYVEKIIVMCDMDDCPRFVLHSGKVVHIPVPDPKGLGLEYTRSVRDEIKKMVLGLIP